MAVTVAKAAPSRSIKRGSYGVGFYGASGSSNFVNSTGAGFGMRRVATTKLTLSGTYATGGFALTPADFGMKEISGLLIICDLASNSGAAAVPQLTTVGGSPNVQLYTDNVPTELANATSVTNWTYTVLIVGI